MSEQHQQNNDLEQLTSDQFRDVIGRFASGVTVVTATRDGSPLGTTASAFTSLSLEPPMILVCMNKTSDTGQAINESGVFGINILGESHPDLAMRFAGKGDKKFENITFEHGAAGEPLLVDALANLECRVTEKTSGGTHFVFIASVERAVAKPGNPLAYFRGKFGRFTPDEDTAALRELRHRVITRDLPIDRPIDLDALSEEMGIERSTLYYALAELSNEGLVRRLADGHLQVVGVTTKLITDTLLGRGTIELGVATRRSGNLTDEEFARCSILIEEIERMSDVSLQAWLGAFESYLNAFVALGGTPTLIDAYSRMSMMTIVTSRRWASVTVQSPPPKSWISHRTVLDAMHTGDTAAAIAEINHRVDGTIRGLSEAIEQAGGEL